MKVLNKYYHDPDLNIITVREGAVKGTYTFWRIAKDNLRGRGRRIQTRPMVFFGCPQEAFNALDVYAEKRGFAVVPESAPEVRSCGKLNTSNYSAETVIRELVVEHPVVSYTRAPKQISLPDTKPTSGTELYYCRYTNRWGEVCPGGLVFNLGEKEKCSVCVKSCTGCIEMRINLDPGRFDDLAHLVSRPERLRPDLRERVVREKA